MFAKKIKIYLGSLSHNYACNGPFTHPINLGYITSYAKKYFDKPESLDIRLYVYANDIIDEIKKDPPDILGLACYSWNNDLNHRILKFVKKEYPKTITIMGGPNFDNYQLEEYFLSRPFLDYFIVNQGETGFLELIKLYANGTLNKSSSEAQIIDNVAYYNNNIKKVCIGDISKRYKDLDVIPSPYLDGTLDKFFDDTNLIPVIETFRGCPFSCTFCAWGDDWLKASNRYSTERVNAEIDYIAKKYHSLKIKFNGYLYFADSNFGMHRRDIDIAKKIRATHDKYNWPKHVWITWAKNCNEKVIEIASILKPMMLWGVYIAYESLDDTTLKNVKRSNISLEKFNKVREYIKSKGLRTHTDLILGLPGETKESYLKGLRQVFDQKFDQIITFNCRVLGGTELKTPNYVKKHGIKTKYRMLVQCYGNYRGITSIENEEVILSTNTMSEEEIMPMRAVNWLVYLLWNNAYYIEFMKFMQQLHINPMDFILELMNNLSKSKSKDEMGDLFKKFQQQSEGEWYDTPEKLYEDNKQIINGKLKGENFGKLNAEYTFKAIFVYRNEMSKKLLEVAKIILKNKFGLNFVNSKEKELADVISYCSEKCINFNDIKDGKAKDIKKYFIYDYPHWFKNYHGEEAIEKYNGGVNINFYLSREKQDRIKKAMEIHNYEDVEKVHMKLLEVLDTQDLFYDIKYEHDYSLEKNGLKDRGITNWELES